MTGVLDEIAAGRFDAALPGLGRGDEIGAMARAMDRFRDAAIDKANRDADEREAARIAADQQHRAEVKRLADTFETAVAEVIGRVSTTAGDLEAAADALTRTASGTQRLSASVAAASEQAAGQRAGGGRGRQPDDAAVGEIGRHVQESSRIAADAVRQAGHTDERIKQLAEGGRAYRRRPEADHGGRRADQSAGAERHHRGRPRRRGRARLRGRRPGGQGASRPDRQGDRRHRRADHRHAGRDDRLGRLDRADRRHHRADGGDFRHHRGGRRAAGAATGEIARSITQAAQGTTQVAHDIGAVSQGAAETGSASAQVLSAAQALGEDSRRLEDAVARFPGDGAGGVTFHLPLQGRVNPDYSFAACRSA